MKKTIVTIMMLLLLVLSGCKRNAMSDEEYYEAFRTVNEAQKLKETFKEIAYLDERRDQPYRVYDKKGETYTSFFEEDQVLKTSLRMKDFLYTLEGEDSFSQQVVLKQDTDVWGKAQEILSHVEFDALEKTDAFYIVRAHVLSDHLKEVYGNSTNVISAEMDLLFSRDYVLKKVQGETLTLSDGSKENLGELEFYYDAKDSQEERNVLLKDHFDHVKEYRGCLVIVDEEGKDLSRTQYNIARGDGSGVVLPEGFSLVQRLSVGDDSTNSNDVTYYVTNKNVEEMEMEHIGEISTDGVYEDDASGFVSLSDYLPDLLLEIRYSSSYNFVGEKIDGYEKPLALLSFEAARALKGASDDLKAKGYLLKIYDAYRPSTAVAHFVRWAADVKDDRMKEIFYPDVDKKDLFAQGYISQYSSHSRGSTLDLTLVDRLSGKEVDMGSVFDLFSEVSHSDYRQLSEEQLANRAILKEAMEAHGFVSLKEEWWHFTLKDEPYPDTYFSFPVNDSVLR